jgi:hypothetical protein
MQLHLPFDRATLSHGEEFDDELMSVWNFTITECEVRDTIDPRTIIVFHDSRSEDRNGPHLFTGAQPEETIQKSALVLEAPNGDDALH